METFYKITPVLYLVVAILMLLAGVVGQSRNRKPAWNMIIVGAALTQILHLSVEKSV